MGSGSVCTLLSCAGLFDSLRSLREGSAKHLKSIIVASGVIRDSSPLAQNDQTDPLPRFCISRYCVILLNIMNVIDEKLARLQKLILNEKSVIVAFSGGVDSSFLLKVCHDTLKKIGGRTVAATGNSASFPASELADAKKITEEIGAKHIIIDTNELKNENYRKNPPDRCYHCKTELFKKLASIAKNEGITAIFDGANADDLSDHRPGLRARDEKGVISPLQEACLTKDEIRALSKKMGLFTWDKPAYACLASRLPYGSSITAESLKMVETAESAIRRLGFSQVRVRHHGEVARIEFLKEDIPRAIDATVADSIYKALKKAGFLYVSVDIKGYRQGSMNETKG